MIVSGTRSILTGATCTALPLAPGYSGAQPLTRGSTPFDQFLHRLLEPNREASSEHAREQTATAPDLLQIDTYGTGIAAVLSDNR